MMTPIQLVRAGAPRVHVMPVSRAALRLMHAVSLGLVLASSPWAAVPCLAAESGTGSAGIDLQYVDPAVRPADDFYRHVNAKWLDSVEIPADKSSYDTFDKLSDDAELQLRAIIEGLAARSDLQPGTDEQRIADLYRSFMDEARAEALGISPLAAELARIDAVAGKQDIPALMGHLYLLGVTTPLDLTIAQDDRDSTRYAVVLDQSGIGLPDRDYYLKTGDKKLQAILAQYRVHVTRTLTTAGVPDAATRAREIVALETALARVQWTKVANRDPIKTYNKVPTARLRTLARGFDWEAWAASVGFAGHADYLLVHQPSYVKGWDVVLAHTSLDTWKAYFKWQLVRAYAPLLNKDAVEEEFHFSRSVVRGIPENRPRWKRGVAIVEESIGEGLGRLYVEKHFPQESKARMEKLVGNLLAAYRESIDHLPWMGEETRRQAQAKLAKFNTKIGYPKRWKDYSRLEVRPGDSVGNVMRARTVAAQRELDKLGKPIDRDEWDMTPQTVNAYYNPSMNEIVFPAAILRPPFFDPAADDAVNYGGIGAVIGHEISHGFDDQGAQYDGDGNLRDWWTKSDHTKFARLTHSLVAQYSAYSPLPGYHVNGELTLGENIADNSGLAIAYKAYEIALEGKPAPVIDGLSGEQRFYYGWAQVWRGKVRDPETIRLIKIDPHSPDGIRGNGPLGNQPGFYAAFGLKPGDRMYVAPEKRVIIW